MPHFLHRITSRPYLHVLLALGVLGGVFYLGAAAFEIHAVRDAMKRVMINFTGDTNAYYQVQQAPHPTGTWSATDMVLGQDGLQAWTNENAAADLPEHLYYKVRELSRIDPLDVDDDGLDDVAELVGSTDPLLPDTDADGMQDGPEDGRVTDPLVPNEWVTIQYPGEGQVLP